MKIEKKIYKVFYKGKQFALPITIVVGMVRKEKVPVHSRKK